MSGAGMSYPTRINRALVGERISSRRSSSKIWPTRFGISARQPVESLCTFPLAYSRARPRARGGIAFLPSPFIERHARARAFYPRLRAHSSNVSRSRCYGTRFLPPPAAKLLSVILPRELVMRGPSFYSFDSCGTPLNFRSFGGFSSGLATSNGSIVWIRGAQLHEQFLFAYECEDTV